MLWASVHQANRITQAMPSAMIQAMVKRCILEQPLMQWCMAFSACVDFTHPPKQLLEIVQALFGGWLQSRINEQANKILRDGERTDNASKVSPSFRASVFRGGGGVGKST